MHLTSGISSVIVNRSDNIICLGDVSAEMLVSRRRKESEKFVSVRIEERERERERGRKIPWPFVYRYKSGEQAIRST